MDKKYKSFIDCEGSILKIRVIYEQCTTKEEEEFLRRSYQSKLYGKTGRKVPLEEIEVHPTAGEVSEITAFFSVRLGEPLYVGLPKIHQRAPYVLPLLIKDLETYRKENPREPEVQLVQRTITGLRKVIESCDTPIDV
jgi:hypothetical protein